MRAINANGIISTLAGNGIAGYSGDGGPATQAQLNGPVGLAASKNGEFYIGDRNNNVIRKINRAGTISTYAGTGVYGFSGDLGPASSAQLGSPKYLAISNDGTLYFSDAGNLRIRKITRDGIISTFAGNGNDSAASDATGDQGSATATPISDPRGVALNQNGELLVADTTNQWIRKISNTFPQAQANGYSIPSTNGSEIYNFDLNGRHLTTQNGLTGGVIWSFSYDTSGKLLSATDGYGNVTSIQRSSSGDPVSITSPYGQVTTLALDGLGNLAAVTNPNAETYSIKYTAGLISQFTKPNGATSTLTFDSLGQLTKDQNAVGGFTALTQSLLGNGNIQVAMSTGEGRLSTTTFGQTLFGQETTSVASLQRMSYVTSYETGTLNQEVSGESIQSVLQSDPRLGLPATVNSSVLVSEPGGPASTSTMVRTYTPSTTSDPFAFSLLDTSVLNGAQSLTSYSGATKTWNYTSAAGRMSSISLNNLGHTTQLTTGSFTPFSFSYDNRGNLTTISQGNRATTLSYDSFGRVSDLSNALGQKTSYSYDLSDHLISSKLPDGRTVGYTYDSNGNVISITPPNKAVHSFAFDLIDQAIGYVSPQVNSQPSTTLYTYNLDHQIFKVTRPDGELIQYSYAPTVPDLLSVKTVSGNYSFVYNLAGQKISAISPDSVTTSYTYHGKLVTGVSNSGRASGVVSYAYNSDFNASAITINGAQVSYTYDQDRFVVGAGPLTLTREVNLGLVSGTSVGNFSDFNSYSSFGELQSYQTGSALYSLSLARDAVGRITSKRENVNGMVNSFNYIFDASGRLISTSKNGALLNSYSYDANGNRIGATLSGQSFLGTYDAQDRLLSYGANSYSYNPNGEMTIKVSPQGSTSYSYNAFGNLKGVTLPNGTQISYLLDEKNRRVAELKDGATSVQYIYQSDLQVGALLDDKGNIVERFIFASKANVPDLVIKGTATYRIISDSIGTVRLVINVSNNQIAQQIDYDDFGNVLIDTNPGFQPFGFAGGLYDQDTKILHFGERDYDPETGRFVSKDPTGFGISQIPGGVANIPELIRQNPMAISTIQRRLSETNLYGYTMNDPINFIDPQGLFDISIGGSTFVINGNTVGAAIGAGLVCGAITGNPVAGVAAGIAAGVAVGYTQGGNGDLTNIINLFQLNAPQGRLP